MIKTIHSSEELSLLRREMGSEVGLVPTMGNLHRGHLSLIQTALSHFDHVIITIFVNPKQFSQGEDFSKYPRTLEEDINHISKLDKINKKIFIYAPENINDIYPENFSTTIKVSGITDVLCGESRPDHFEGVTTIVYLLFSLTKPKVAYFGEKDYQQVIVIKRMVKDLLIPVEIRSLPIVRDVSGLALSSRNNYLNEKEKKDALELRETLLEIKDKVKNGNHIKVNQIIIEKNNLPHWDYLQILDGDSLLPISDNTSTIVLAGAIIIGKTRLIDNISWNN